MLLHLGRNGFGILGVGRVLGSGGEIDPCHRASKTIVDSERFVCLDSSRRFVPHLEELISIRRSLWSQQIDFVHSTIAGENKIGVSQFGTLE